MHHRRQYGYVSRMNWAADAVRVLPPRHVMESANHYTHVMPPGSLDSHEEEPFPEDAKTRTGAVREATH